MIKTTDLCRSYDGRDILKNIDISIEPGTFTAIIGANGSGKSTLAKHFNAILLPQRGEASVDGISTRDKDRVYDIRERVGMVFQDPDSQAVASIVEDDTAFAPENLGLDEEEIEARIEFALAGTDISHLRRRSISTLSGGQKQLTAISGILAMRPGYMVFDESTSMLDPISRRRVLECVRQLRDERGLAIIWITHYMDEAALADRVIVLNRGSVAADGTPVEVFSDTATIEECGLELPGYAALWLRLRGSEPIPRTPKDCAVQIKRLLEGKNDQA